MELEVESALRDYDKERALRVADHLHLDPELVAKVLGTHRAVLYGGPPTIGSLPDYKTFAAGGGYPEVTGYANVADVQANINAGTWDPTKATATPTNNQVGDMLKIGTAQVNLALRNRGYFVPLVGQGGFQPPKYMQAADLIQGIMPEVWFELRYVTAAYATHRVLMTRSSAQKSQETALEWMHLFDDFVSRLEAAADNLWLMGADGDFPPLPEEANMGLGSGELDPSVATGNVDPLDPSTWMNQWDGTPQGIFSTTEGLNQF